MRGIAWDADALEGTTLTKRKQRIMYEEVAYSYYDTAGNYIWYGTLTGVHVVRNNQSYVNSIITSQSEAVIRW